ncbi:MULTISPECIES: YafY family protein [unclassified Bosea (in: a-proteobacteria)]|uniref:helix-turn-helix transcriptional regulator n=1 Tax=unclassified Bosea (in: a-proteobacteria) TaxID=2653178 RepID=UPI000956A70A|nr:MULTISPECIES: YafY family protein [unclassified Bosea (in: a-proteobacteria)]TAJ33682.1 MAG: YafY family transcriptional regulator [Bosea sp. (in: a-proteobacteria)]SIQ49707.1 Predicted DNA-binding transcriptional regulator YafY, contains an HTH and WYL domains [Bosea sp. TND4EK4]
MSRAERLLDLVQLLRRHRRPVSGRRLADELGVSIRTLYRDIVTLQGQGAPIEGEPGLGYVLKPGFMLPPLMFGEDEIEALLLGSGWVADRADGPLALAARDAMAKIVAVLPPDLTRRVEEAVLMVGPGRPLADMMQIDLALVRRTIRAERKALIAYGDGEGRMSERLVWPLALSFFDHVRILIAWCELRQDFRHFRADRIGRFEPSETRYPQRRAALLKNWREQEGVPSPR